MVRVEAKVCALRPYEDLHEQSASNQENHRESHLSADQNAARKSGVRPASQGSPCGGGTQGFFHGHEGRCDSTQENRGHGSQSGNAEDSSIQFQIGACGRSGVGYERRKAPDATSRQQNTRNPA